MKTVCDCHHEHYGDEEVGEGESVIVGVEVVVGVVGAVEGLCSGNGGCRCSHSSKSLAWLLDCIHLFSLLPL